MEKKDPERTLKYFSLSPPIFFPDAPCLSLESIIVASAPNQHTFNISGASYVHISSDVADISGLGVLWVLKYFKTHDALDAIFAALPQLDEEPKGFLLKSIPLTT